jgi:SAM-dependent methyltransferase
MNLDTIRADFDAIARLGDRYPSGSDRFDEFVLGHVPADARRVLDVGCGTGRLVTRLAQGGKACVGVDVSQEMIRRATAASAIHPAVSLRCGDFLSLDIEPQVFDCVVSMAALHHMPHDAAVARMQQVLRPGGRLILHDLRASSNVFDEVASLSVLFAEAGKRFVRTGWPFDPRPVRRVWAAHEAHDRYLTLEQVEALVTRLLPGAMVVKHRGWRYTIVWDNPPG